VKAQAFDRRTHWDADTPKYDRHGRAQNAAELRARNAREGSASEKSGEGAAQP
jgi:hypothetical protein